MIETDSDLEDFEEFYDAPLEFMDSFERSVQMSAEVKLDGDSNDSDANAGPSTPESLRRLALRQAKLQNGATTHEDRDYVDDLASGSFSSSLDKIQLKKSKYR